MDARPEAHISSGSSFPRSAGVVVLFTVSSAPSMVPVIDAPIADRNGAGTHRDHSAQPGRRPYVVSARPASSALPTMRPPSACAPSSSAKISSRREPILGLCSIGNVGPSPILSGTSTSAVRSRKWSRSTYQGSRRCRRRERHAGHAGEDSLSRPTRIRLLRASSSPRNPAAI